jgi:DNA primase
MINKQLILENTNLISIINSALKKVASTGGGEYAGPCPYCGGKDRFRVQPNQKPWGLWMCRQCGNGKWKNAIDFIIQRDGVDFINACKTLGGDDLSRINNRVTVKQSPQPAYTPPAADWQEQAKKAIEKCQANLWSDQGREALNWLRSKRGLKDATIKRFLLGFSPGLNVGDLWIPHGVIIPCVVAGEVWYLKVRTNSNHKGEKYKGVKGNRTNSIFNAEDLTSAAPGLFCEGEFDTILAWQELGDVVTPVTFGSAGNLPDLATWGAYLLPVILWLLAYDADDAGKNGAAKVMNLTNRAVLALLPDDMDITDYYQENGDLWSWIRQYLDCYDPIPSYASLTAAAMALGGVARHE